MTFTHFLILDDDPISGVINELAVNEAFGSWNSKTFNDPVDCLDYIRASKPDATSHTCILLDINMPRINGWEFLTEFSRLPQPLVNAYSIVIVSSSYDPTDHQRADAHPLVADYLTKPITADALRMFMNRVEIRAKRA
jgi:CheY-like chemotaxis protein